MTRTKAPDFPALRRVFAGYLHEDFPAEHGTPADALGAFEADASPSELRRFKNEARRLLEQAESLDLAEARALMARLGCRWTPPSRQALLALLTLVTSRSPAPKD